MEKMREEFEKEMIAHGYEPEELLPDEETGGYRDLELVAMWVGWKLGWKAALNCGGEHNG